MTRRTCTRTKPGKCHQAGHRTMLHTCTKPRTHHGKHTCHCGTTWTLNTNNDRGARRKTGEERT